MDQFMKTLGIIINATLMYTPPLLYAALGSCFSEKSGVVNIGIEGMMTVGAFTGAAIGYYVGNPWLAFICAGVAGALFGLLHAFACVTCHSDQTISGTAINFLGSGVAVFVCRMLFSGNTETHPVKAKLPRILNGMFESLAANYPDGIGKLFVKNGFLDNAFNTYASTYIAFLLVLLFWFVFFRTRFGMWLRAVGEHPKAADTLGINVFKVRYICVILSGFLAGLGGASITLATVSAFRPSVVIGQGFIAIAAVIFGKFTPQGAMLGCILFGFCNGLRVILGSNSVIPVNLISMIPYVVTILTLVLFVGKSRVPAANGKPYFKSK